MESFCLLLGHLLGDYVLQNDWQARNKGQSSAVCAYHCALYGLAVQACNCWWLPAWAILVVAGLHFPVDRWRLARKWMMLAGQEEFATGPFAPWSIVLVDNIMHLLVLGVLGVLLLEN